ncbi:CDP-glucose 4,6-dehydratase [Clostridium aestuarii]|uniref:CDP-glucose 4,6-dehydratase n=1 Tax=Clostridium aestuarii TaxID=338193 RepID=A0ABT4CXC6_9CLOT|nr:CDP-glucose 4,6-dehydratase [Clostridium aestuarii]MCY6482750.1 CDP-glucose 4,6-dehydratase [Clostridium aestuarii]
MDINKIRDFFKGKTVLITGHTGFKGSWLSIWLKELGVNIIGYGLDPYTENDNFVVCKLNNKMTDIRGDIRDDEKLKFVFNKYKPEIVFHLAAQPLVGLSYKIPKETYETNVIGTLNVLECIKNTDSVKVGVMITTDKCYENKEQIWSYREVDALGGYDPYSASKACAELLIASYRNSFMNTENYAEHGKAIASVRAGNVIGGGDWAKDRLIPDCIRSLINNRTIEIRNSDSVRPWQHVLEPLYGYMLLATKMYSDGIKYSGAWNFGPNYTSIVPVKKVVNFLIQYWEGDSIEKGLWKNVQSTSNYHESKLLSLDCTKAKTYLEWYPRLSIEKSIDFTVRWYKNFFIQDPYEICLKQIKNYINLV